MDAWLPAFTLLAFSARVLAGEFFMRRAVKKPPVSVRGPDKSQAPALPLAKSIDAIWYFRDGSYLISILLKLIVVVVFLSVDFLFAVNGPFFN